VGGDPKRDPDIAFDDLASMFFSPDPFKTHYYPFVIFRKKKKKKNKKVVLNAMNTTIDPTPRSLRTEIVAHKNSRKRVKPPFPKE